jgi:cytochrome c-type biogenesis protein CcmH/NrfF
MLWIVPLLCAVLGTACLALLAARMRREIPPLHEDLRNLRGALRPVLLEVRDDTRRLRTRTDRGR